MTFFKADLTQKCKNYKTKQKTKTMCLINLGKLEITAIIARNCQEMK